MTFQKKLHPQLEDDNYEGKKVEADDDDKDDEEQERRGEEGEETKKKKKKKHLFLQIWLNQKTVLCALRNDNRKKKMENF